MTVYTPFYDVEAVDLFAGPGGWDVAAILRDLHSMGIEFDKAAVETRQAAGLPTIHDDVRNLHPALFPNAKGLIASPPCQTFSIAGKGSGTKALGLVLRCIEAMAARLPLPAEAFEDERTALVLEPLRWALEAIDNGRPFRWLAFEQVATVLPVWKAMAAVLADEGYSVDAATVSAEQYGVPQTRKRAILVASLDREVSIPAPTHSRYHSRTPERMDEGLLPWVSMAEALGWGMTKRPSYTFNSGGARASHSGSEWGGNSVRKGMLDALDAAEAGTGSDFIPRGWGMTHRPYPTIAPGTAAGGTDPQAVGGSGARKLILRERAEGRWVEKWWDDAPDAPPLAEQWERLREAKTSEGLDRVRDQSGTAVDLSWPSKRPSTTLATRDLVQHPGTTANRFQPTATKSRNDGIRVSIEEAATLQTFPDGYPWQGTRSKVYQQIGNAVPPLLADAVLDAVGAFSEAA